MIVKVIFYTTIVVDVMEADMGVEEMDQTTPTSCASSAPTSVIVNITGELCTNMLMRDAEGRGKKHMYTS